MIKVEALFLANRWGNMNVISLMTSIDIASGL